MFKILRTHRASPTVDQGGMVGKETGSAALILIQASVGSWLGNWGKMKIMKICSGK